MTTRVFASAAWVLAAATLVGCSPERPAQQAIQAAEQALAAAPAEAERYLGADYTAVTDHIAEAKAALEAKNYQGALEHAKLATEGTGGFAAAIEAKKAQFTESWSSMSKDLPAAVTAIEQRVTDLGKMRRLPAGVTKENVAGAQTALSDAKATWTEAMTAYENGNLLDAVTKGTAIQTKMAEVKQMLGMEM